MVNYSVSIFSAAGVSDLMTGESSVAVMMGKLSENVVEIFRIIVSMPRPSHSYEKSSDALIIGSAIGIGPIMTFLPGIGIGRFADNWADK